MYVIIQNLFDKFWMWLVNLIALFISDILLHPKVNDAISKSIMSGINATIEQPEFATRINKLTQTAMLETNVDDNAAFSRQIGEQFPQLAVQFLGGAVSSARRGKSTKKL